jgi:Flp pilus assembly protein TadG
MRFFNDWNTRRRLRTTGQALILIVLTFLGLLLFLGLMIDLGQIFLAKGYLRRAADASALAAAAQFRENRDINDMTAAAKEVSHINGVDPTTIWVQTCKDGGTGSPGPDTSLCPATGKIPKKLVRVTITMDYPLTFLSLLNIYKVTLVESSVSEAAAMDVVLVIDVSESMNWDHVKNPSLHALSDPANPEVCNNTTPNSCEPFAHVISAAKAFSAEILNKADPIDEEDRLAIVTFANGWQGGPLGTQIAMSWTNEYDDAAGVLDGLDIYDPGPNGICPFGDWGCGDDPTTDTDDGPACPQTLDDIPTGACLYYSDPDPLNGNKYVYGGLNCARLSDLDVNDPTNIPTSSHWSPDWAAISACNTTNIGGGLYHAGYQFGIEKRLDALWVVVLLTDGAANATFGTNADLSPSGNDEYIFPSQEPEDFLPYLPYGFCPSDTWIGPGSGHVNDSTRRFCQDGDVDTYHPFPSNPGEYDADDFARDQAKTVACYASKPSASCGGVKGQGAVIFTIGLGNEILAVDDDPVTPKPYGASLLRYMAAIGDDGDADTDLCAT